MSDSPSPGWRDIDNPSSAADGQRPWQTGAFSADVRTPSPSRRGLKRLIALLVLVAISGAIGAIVVLLRPVKQACLVVIGAGYETNLLLPHNAHGWHGAQSLLTDDGIAVKEPKVIWPWESARKLRRVEPAEELKAERKWSDIWRNVSAFRERTLILFVSAHALADKDDVVLLADDANIKTRIAFKDILESVSELRKVKKNVVLFLDIAQVQSHWPIGLMHNDVVQRLEKDYRAKIEAAENLVVICAAGVDQRSWASDEWQNSVFGHFVAEGLRGAALKGSVGKLSVRDLFAYVEKEVDHWAQTARARRQQPVMWAMKSLPDSIGLINIDSPYEPARSFQPEPRERETKATESAWQDWASLKARKPFVHAPHAWRLYQHALVRYEELQRAGDPTKQAAKLKEQLDKTHDDVGKTLTLHAALDSLTGSFPMVHVLGFHPRLDRLDGLFTKLRRTDLDKLDEVIAAVQTTAPIDKAYLQVALGREFLREFDQPAKLDRDAEQAWIAALEAALRQPRRPAELHFFKMLQDVHPGLDDETIRLALRTRVLAEEAALSVPATDADSEPYSAVIFPWIENAIKEADARRREGEDALFGNPETHGTAARTLLEQAEGMYTKARAKAVTLRRGLAVRDELWSDLPELVRWSAILPRGQALADTQDLRDGLPGLRENVIDLGRKLDALDVQPDVARIAVLSKQIQSVHKEMRDKYRAAAETLTDVAFQGKWHEHEAALSIPPVAGTVELRLKLLRQLESISGELHAAFLKESADEKKGRKLVEEEESAEARKTRLRAVLEAVVSDPLARGEPNLDGELQSFLLSLPEEIAAKSQKDSVRLAPLLQAAQLCRWIPAGLAKDIVVPLDPVDRLRRLSMHNLLMAQAERTWQDHWFEPRQDNTNTDAAAYYLGTGRTFLKSAGALVKDDRSRAMLDAKLAAFEREKMQLARLTTPDTVQKFWTSQLAFSLNWEIDASSSVPPGKPMGWLEIASAKEARPQELGNRTELEWPPVTKPFPPLKRADIWGADATPNSKRRVAFRGVYRGQQLRSDIDFQLVKPDVFATHVPPPKSAGLATRMDPSFNYGAISIVLDNSGSMRYLHPLEFDEDKKEKTKDRYPKKKCRFDYALDALETVLDKIPNGTSLSFFRFYTNDRNETDVEFLREPFPLARKAKELADLRHDLKVMNSNLDNRYFNNNSPIAQAIKVSMEKGFVGKNPGPKVVLVLTDGMDNYSFTKKPRDKDGTTKKVADFIDEAKRANRDTEIVVVCFMQKDDEERPFVEKQFGNLRDNLIIEPNEKELGRKILKLLQPTLKLSLAGEAAPDLTTLPVNLPEGEVSWSSVPPNVYQAQLSRSSSPGIGIDLRAGQNLFLVLKRDRQSFYLERGLLGEQSKPDNALKKRNGDWLVSLLSHGIDPKNKLEQIVTFENVLTENKDPIRQAYPGFVWLELDAYRRDFRDHLPWGNTGLRWENAWDVAAPAFRLTMPWQEDAEPKLTAWYWPRDRADFMEKSFVKDIPLEIGKRRPSNPTRLPVLESVEWESVNKEEALVIRAIYPEGRPVMLAFKKAPPPGARIEHVFYPRAEAYTAYIRGVRSEVAELDFVLIDLTAFKATAEKVTFPSSDEPLPRRIILPRYFQGRSD